MLVFLLVLIVAAILGTMLFFAAVVAPVAFRALPAEEAARFLRRLFPHYYLVLGSASVLALVLATLLAAGGGGRAEVALLGFTALGFAFARTVLAPRIDAARTARAGGDEAAARRFAGLHRLSMVLNVLQMLALAWVCVTLAGAGIA